MWCGYTHVLVDRRDKSRLYIAEFSSTSHYYLRRLKRLKSICIFLVIASGVWSQDVSLLQSIQQDSAVDLYLTLDWKAIEKNKNEKTYVPAKVIIITPGMDSIHLDAKVRTRGHMRLDICSFPPLKLKFEKDQMSRYHLTAFNEMDIVNHCEDSDMHDQLLLKEYLAYKLWELVSPYYFKVQLIRLHYLKPDGTQAHGTAYAFLMENTEELVARLDARRNKTPVISTNAVEKEPMLRVALFEYMIGNTDWYITNRHNLEFVAIPGFNVLVPIPYDFDYSGLVSAPYAAHHASIDLPSVTIRYYQGKCATEDVVRKILKSFLDQKEKILMAPHHIQGLNEKSINSSVSYLKEFYDIIENPKKLENFILEHCDMWPVKE